MFYRHTDTHKPLDYVTSSAEVINFKRRIEKLVKISSNLRIKRRFLYVEPCISRGRVFHQSLCPSVTRWYCVKTTQARITKSSPTDSPMSPSVLAFYLSYRQLSVWCFDKRTSRPAPHQQRRPTIEFTR